MSYFTNQAQSRVYMICHGTRQHWWSVGH